jgi:excisionase family DNA binding protein
MDTLLKEKADNLIRVREAAQILPFTKMRIYELVAKNQIPHIRLGKTIFFKRDELARFLEEGSIPRGVPMIPSRQERP